MKNARFKDILRTIKKEKKRFFSILLITALGVTMLTGLRAACSDLRYSADSLYDRQNLFDIQISSTLGLDENDVEALAGLDEVSAVEGEYSADVYTDIDGANLEAEVRTMGEEINVPTVVEGRLPEAADEIAVNETYLLASGKQVGDTITFSENASESADADSDSGTAADDPETADDAENDDGEDSDDSEDDSVFVETEYVITAEVLNPFDVNNREGSVSFRSSTSADYVFFVTQEAVDTDVYTAVYISLADTEELLCYSSEYKEKVESVKSEIQNTLKEKQQELRYETVYNDAMEEYTDAEEEALEKLDDAQQEINDGWAELEDGRAELEDGREELEDGKQELEDGKKELAESKAELETQEANANSQIADGQAQIDSGYAQLNEGKETLDASAEEIAEGEAQIAAAREELEAKKTETLAQIDDGIAQCENGKEELESGIVQVENAITQIEAAIAQMQAGAASSGSVSSGEDALEGGTSNTTSLGVTSSDAVSSGTSSSEITTLEELQTQLTTQKATLSSLKEQLETVETQLAELQAQRAAAETQFAEAEAEIDAQAQTLADGKTQYEQGIAAWNESKAQLDESQEALNEQAASGKVQIASAWEQIFEAEEQLATAEAELADGEAELADAEVELADGEQELVDGQAELDENREEALAKLADAKEEIDEIEPAKWYIQGRDSLSGYSNVDNDATSIEGLATFLPLIFFAVAILISLTAITRMVEEDRGLVGTYKALGFTNSEIRSKYIIYAAIASLAGGVVGDICGFVILPKIIFTFFGVMYIIPVYELHFALTSGVSGILLFLVGILLAVWLAVKTELNQMPAALMRPLVPKQGSRIFLEYIPALWKKMSFLNKVTARNLFRYKKRLIMTVVGIMGCTGLLICGFSIKNTVTDLMPKQYENVNRYDILAVAQADDNDKILSYMEDTENIESYINIEVTTVSIENAEGESESVQLFVFPDDAEVSDFIKLADTSGNEISLAADGLMVTHSAADVLGLVVGDEVALQDISLNEAQVTVAAVTENYLGDLLYISESCYEEAFGLECEQNAVLVNLTEDCRADDPIAYAKELGAKDGFISTTSTDTLKAEFSKAFTLINLVVYVILVLAAGLAFVVLFTLSTTNISERSRELATIKVLGFFDREVHLYVNKETLILTVLGILLGMPAGWAISNCLTWALKIPGLYFDISIHLVSYFICGGLAFAFALIVNQITNRLLNAIDPVEALKSVE